MYFTNIFFTYIRLSSLIFIAWIILLPSHSFCQDHKNTDENFYAQKDVSQNHSYQINSIWDVLFFAGKVLLDEFKNQVGLSELSVKNEDDKINFKIKSKNEKINVNGKIKLNK